MKAYEFILEGYSHAIMKKDGAAIEVEKNNVQNHKDDGWILSYWVPDTKAAKPGRKKKSRSGSIKIRK